MVSDIGKADPPTFYANVVTMNLNVDELTIELRRYLASHKDHVAAVATGTLKPLASPSAKELLELDPIARVVLTYSAAKALKEYLEKAFPEIEKSRKG